MFSWHPSDRLAAFCDGQLPVAEARVIESHLATCERCRRACDDVRFAASALRALPLASPPPSVWNALDQRLRQGSRPARMVQRRRVTIAIAASLLLLAAAGTLYRLGRHLRGGPWQVAIEQAGGARTIRHGAGDWIETSSDSRARIVVGTIGTVNLEPNARVQLGVASGSQYRLSLERGTLSAEISAPPRMFIVETPATTVVDLGCAYTMTVGSDGAMELRMTSGWAALEWQGTETLVPAGAMSRSGKGHQPGVPYFEDAPMAFQEALRAMDTDGVTDTQLGQVLETARVRDTLTLWHLLARTDARQRSRVYERLQQLVPMPGGVTAERVLNLDPDALRTWREELAWHW
jgi:anti-sigma factor RsiW